MGRERVAEPVRVSEDAAQGGGVEAPAARRHEECVLGTAHELRTRLPQVAREPVRGFFAERNDSLLAALPEDPHLLLLEIDVREVELDGLPAAQAGRVDKLDERTVSESERLVVSQRFERRLDLGAARRIR